MVMVPREPRGEGHLLMLRPRVLRRRLLQAGVFGLQGLDEMLLLRVRLLFRRRGRPAAMHLVERRLRLSLLRLHESHESRVLLELPGLRGLRTMRLGPHRRKRLRESPFFFVIASIGLDLRALRLFTRPDRRRLRRLRLPRQAQGPRRLRLASRRMRYLLLHFLHRRHHRRRLASRRLARILEYKPSSFLSPRRFIIKKHFFLLPRKK